MKVSTVFYSDSGQLFYDVKEAEINDKIESLNQQINKLILEMEQLQNECPHMHMTVQAKSDTGNYCRDDDSYWFRGECRSCGKIFTVDQSKNSLVRERYSSHGKDPRVIKL